MPYNYHVLFHHSFTSRHSTVDPDPGLQRKPTRSWCLSYETECIWTVLIMCTCNIQSIMNACIVYLSFHEFQAKLPKKGIITLRECFVNNIVYETCLESYTWSITNTASLSLSRNSYICWVWEGWSISTYIHMKMRKSLSITNSVLNRPDFP